MKSRFAIVLLLVCFFPTCVVAQKFNRAVSFASNFEASIPHPEQDKLVEDKLAKLKAKTGKRPNIVWIIIDDMGYGDPGCYGGGEAIGAATENIDRLAREGLRLTSCYSQHTCTPTRSAILTGRLPVRTGLTRPILAGDKITKNPWADEVSLAKLLSEAGYTTNLTGKWHIGEAVGMRPQDVGFDEFYGFYPAQKEISQSVDPRRYPDLVLNPELLKAYNDIGSNLNLVHGFKGGKTTNVSAIKSTEEMGRADQVLADFTIAKIKELAKSDKPFFLEHCFMKVHCDNFANPDYVGKSKAKYAYKDNVWEVDMHVGQIMKTLKEEGLLENTFVFLTSDNGPQMDAWPDAGYTPFRGAKGTTFEGGVRVPGIAYWKGIISPGQQSDDVFDLMDLFGTALKLADVSYDKLPNDRFYDFIDQTSYLLTDQGKSNRESIYFWWGTVETAIRMREYKLHTKVILPKSKNLYIDMSLLVDLGLAPWLFNLYIDPKEQTTVGHRRNAWLATIGGQLKAHLKTFKKYPPKKIGLGF
ncbi:MAG: arylsulfatase [Mariniblastus sp.]|nr:arylsulfatase [Mariniblastus sp.]